MILVEQHQIKATPVLKEQFFASKNLYNSALYLLRQHFFAGNEAPISYPELYRQLRDSPEYKSLPAKVSQQILIKTQKTMVGFLAAKQEFLRNPIKFLSAPKLPKYKDKSNGQFLLIYTVQAISLKAMKKGLVVPSQSGLEIPTKIDPNQIKEVRIVPNRNRCVVEIVYEVQEKPLKHSENYVGLDIGVNNLVALTSNKQGFVPVLVNGRPLKSINQFYNKQRAKFQNELGEGLFTSNKLRKLQRKRNNKIKDYLHKSSNKIIDLCLENDISKIVVGKNPFWKQNVKMGKRNNQNFVQVPFAQFIEMLTYKANLVGIILVTQEESYTSKCSFLDKEDICFHSVYAGKRVKRGLFKSSTGKVCNADVNGSYNILKKAIPDAFSKGIEGVVVHPRLLKV